MSWTAAVLVFLGGGVGALMRYGVAYSAVRAGIAGPWPTLGINVLGSLAIGLLGAWVVAGALAADARADLRLLLGVGLLGGFTTFSAFSLEAVAFLERRAWGEAGLYVALSVAGAILAAAAGLWLGRRLWG